jgi:hypothetical protein
MQVKNRLLAAFLPNSAAKIADGGAPHDADEWAIAFALGPNEAQVVTSGTFQRQFVPAIEQAYEKALADPAMRKKLDSTVDQGVDQAKRDYGVEGELSLKMGVMSPLGIYAKNAHYVVYGAGTKIQIAVNGENLEIPLVMILSTINVKDRLLGAAVYRKLRSRADIDVAKAKAIEWSNAVVKLNP